MNQRSSRDLDEFLYERSSIQLEIHRSHILEDSYRLLSPASTGATTSGRASGSKLKKRIQVCCCCLSMTRMLMCTAMRVQVQFISEQGHTEAGIDGGGLFKSFIESFIKSSFDPKLGFFQPTDEQLLVCLICHHCLISGSHHTSPPHLSRLQIHSLTWDQKHSSTTTICYRAILKILKLF